MWWFSAAFTALLVVTVVGVGFYFLPAMFTPAPRVPDFQDVDELVKVSRQSIRPEQGTVVGPPLPGTNVRVPRSGFPVPACDVSGEPSPK